MATFAFLDGPLHALHWSVLRVTGVEAVSSLYRFEVTAACPRDDVESALHDEPLEMAALGRRVRLGFADDDAARRFGLVGAVTVTGVARQEALGAEAVEVRVEVVPRASLLALRTRSRVFQERYPHEIVSEVLADHGVRHRWAFKNVYPRRLYCVQYQESDWDFVARVLAEEGVFFYFLHGPFGGGERERPEAPGAWERARTYAGYARYASNVSSGMGGALGAVAGASALAADVIAADEEGERDLPLTPRPGAWGAEGEGEVMVLVDHAAFYADALSPDALEGGRRPVELALRAHDAGVVDLATVTTFAARRALRTARVELRDTFFKSPLAVYRAEHAPRVPEAAVDKELEHYAHHGEHERPDVSAENARNALEALRADAATWEGEGRHWGLAAGMRVALHNETHAPVRDGRYALTRVEHRWALEAAAGDGGARVSYANALRCVAADVPARPPRPPRAQRATTELATVVGPPDREVFTDRFGRVRVQFHWDREGRFLAGSSCWVRVAQPWAGAGFGVQFLPRVGMEVLVSFVGGDPDRPVVTAALHNGTHPTPDAFPEHATRSTIRTQTVPGGGGFNELSFEDARGAERVYLHAEKNLDLDVGDAHRTTVRGDQTDVVMAARAVVVGGAQTHAVGGPRAATVGGDDSTAVGGDRSTRVAGSAHERVEGHASARTRGSRHAQVDGASVTHVGGATSSFAAGGRVAHVGSSYMPDDDATLVGGSSATMAGDSVRIAAGLNPVVDFPTLVAEIGESSVLLTREEVLLGASVSINATADQVTLSTNGGESWVSLSAAGIELGGPSVILRSGGRKVVVDGAGVQVVGPRVRVESPDVAFTDGGGGAEDGGDAPARRTEPNVHLLLSHGRHDRVRPLAAGAVCEVILGTFTKVVTIERDGELDLYVPESIRRIELSVVELGGDDADAYDPDDLPLRWTVYVTDEAPERRSAEWTHQSLRRLGYDTAPLRARDFVRADREALQRFQRDHRLAETGEADDPTLAKLEEESAP